MKKYIKPEIRVALFASEDILTNSGVNDDKFRFLITKVNGNEGTDYGSQDVSIFDN